MNGIFNVKQVIIHCILLALLAGCVKDNDNNGGANLTVNEPLPVFTVKLTNGEVVNPSKLANKVSLIVFFSVVCPDCRAQFPVIEQVYKKYSDNENVLLFGISRAQGESMVSEYWRNNGLTFPYSAQNDAALYNLFAQSGVPRIYISDKNKIVRYIYTDNPLANYNDLIDNIEFLLQRL